MGGAQRALQLGKAFVETSAFVEPLRGTSPIDLRPRDPTEAGGFVKISLTENR
jgi:hypothetical protein